MVGRYKVTKEGEEMKIGMIAPINFLDKYCITDTQYCLPRLLVESREYRDFYIGRKKAGDFIILDCRRPSWRREPEDWNLVWMVLGYLKPSTIILPSYMFNVKETIKVTNTFKKDLKKLGITLAGCLEGTSHEEIGYCLTKMRKISEVIAIPSHIFNLWRGEEYEFPKIYIESHLNLEELDGLDGTLITSLPIRLGLEGRLLSDYLPSPPSLTFYEEEDNYPMITKKNVEEAIEYYKTY